ncbi:MAG: prohibitin family protein [Bdellovibrio sp.]|nr:prohibitin family protein [Bdellovibrio sp.]
MKRIIIMAMGLMLLSSCGFRQVNEGYRGIKLVWGKMEGEPLLPGLYFYNPISTTIYPMEIFEQKMEGQTSCYTKDTQSVIVSFAVTYFPEPLSIGKVYTQFGIGWEAKILSPAVVGTIKDAIGGYIADDLVSKREVVTKYAQDEIMKALSARNVSITRLDITNLDFDDTYEKAVEQKVVAIQEAQEAKNRTIKIQEEAKQVVEQARAEAEAMKIKTQAISANNNLVSYEAVQKWNGSLPQIIMGGQSIPFINFDKLMK